jgi:CHASE3 domain sensor protein
LIIATITASVGYLSLYYSQTVAEKFQELVSQTLPAIDSLKEMKTAAIHIETATNEYVFIPGINRSKYLQEINAQTNEFSNNLNKYETLVNTYFPDEKDHLELISKLANLFISNTDKLVNLRQTAASEATLPTTNFNYQARV